LIYEELAEQLLEVTRPKGKRPPLHHMNEQDRAGDAILRYLYDSGGSATPRELAEAFDVSSSRVATLLGALERKGFLRRECDARDRRRIIVEIMPEGEDHILRLQARLRRNLAAVMEKMGEEDAREMLRLATKLVTLVGEEGCFPPHPQKHWKGHGHG